MNLAPAPPWRRLAPLAGAVLLAHLALLLWQPRDRLQPGTQASARFATRSIAPPAAPEPAAHPPAAPAAPPPRPSRVAPQRPPPATKPVARHLTPAAAPIVAPPPAADAQPAAAQPAAAAAHAVTLPPPARLRYEVVAEVRGLPLQGHGTLDWRHDGARYEARMEITGAGRTRVQRSEGRITPQGLAPGYFSDRNRSEQATHFDREQGRVVFSNNRPQAALAEGMQDRLSVVLQLAAMVAAQPGRYASGTQVTIPTASTGEAQPWVFEVEGEEDLQLPGGAVRALKLLRAPRREYDQRVELWLAPRMDYAPVRVRLTNPNGDTVDQRWSSTDKS